MIKLKVTITNRCNYLRNVPLPGNQGRDIRPGETITIDQAPGMSGFFQSLSTIGYNVSIEYTEADRKIQHKFQTLKSKKQAKFNQMKVAEATNTDSANTTVSTAVNTTSDPNSNIIINQQPNTRKRIHDNVISKASIINTNADINAIDKIIGAPSKMVTNPAESKPLESTKAKVIDNIVDSEFSAGASSIKSSEVTEIVLKDNVAVATSEVKSSEVKSSDLSVATSVNTIETSNKISDTITPVASDTSVVSDKVTQSETSVEKIDTIVSNESVSANTVDSIAQASNNVEVQDNTISFEASNIKSNVNSVKTRQEIIEGCRKLTVEQLRTMCELLEIRTSSYNANTLANKIDNSTSKDSQIEDAYQAVINK